MVAGSGGTDGRMIYQQLINGLMLGASYSLIAIGYALIFGVLKLLYFAHGEVFMVGAFVGLFLVTLAGANIYVAMLGAMVACALLGVVSVYVSVRPVARIARSRHLSAVSASPSSCKISPYMSSAASRWHFRRPSPGVSFIWGP